MTLYLVSQVLTLDSSFDRPVAGSSPHSSNAVLIANQPSLGAARGQNRFPIIDFSSLSGSFLQISVLLKTWDLPYVSNGHIQFFFPSVERAFKRFGI